MQGVSLTLAIGVVVSGERHAPAALPRERAPVPIVVEAGRVLVLTGVENRKCLAPTGFRTPDRPARSESLYQLRYPSPCLKFITH